MRILKIKRKERIVLHGTTELTDKLSFRQTLASGVTWRSKRDPTLGKLQGLDLIVPLTQIFTKNTKTYGVTDFK